MIMRYSDEHGVYTLEKEFKGLETRNAHPPKYSPEDRYAKYRRIAKKRQGLL